MLRGKLWVALSLAVTVPLVGGCGKKNLTEIEVPDAGVDLRYDLSAGQAYGGHLKMRNAVQTPIGDMIQSIEFDVELVVSGPIGESNLVAATVTDIKFDVRLPEGMPGEAAKQLPSAEEAAAVSGTQLRFHLDDQGKVTEMPEPPKDVADKIGQVVGMVAGALQAGFVTLPGKPLKNGDTWDPVSADDKGRTGTGTFNGMARDDASGSEVARLTYAYQRSPDAEEGGSGPRVEGSQDIEVLFATDGYPVQIKRKSSGDIKGLGGFNSEVTAEWKKLDKRAVTPPTNDEVQEITDPCDPDYVGPEECGPAEPAEAPADEAGGEEAGGEAAGGADESAAD